MEKIMFFRKKKEKIKPQQKKRSGMFSTDLYAIANAMHDKKNNLLLELPQPRIAGAQDSAINGEVPIFKGGCGYGVPESIQAWFTSQGFIGYNLMAVMAKHWLIEKACGMPARDSIRQGYDIDCEHADVIDKLVTNAAKRDFNKVMREFVRCGRSAGGSAALFVVESTDPEYYEKPFNIDGIGENSYKGVKVISAANMTPAPIDENIQDPANLAFYDPTYWLIAGRKYHRSHFCFFVPYPVEDVLKPQYRYFGVSVPERAYERVYAAERTANEAPQLAMTKRMTTISSPDIYLDEPETTAKEIMNFATFRDNYGTQVVDSQSTVQQFDTSLADLDATIMTQYQLVAAASNVPGTRLLGTQPKGFNSTGDYEEACYREELESVQTNDLEPMMIRHFQCQAKSMGLGEHIVTITWKPLDSPTAKEYADINLAKSQTAMNYASIGAIDGGDVRDNLAADKDSGFYGLEDYEEDTEEEESLGGESEGGFSWQATSPIGSGFE